MRGDARLEILAQAGGQDVVDLLTLKLKEFGLALVVLENGHGAVEPAAHLGGPGILVLALGGGGAQLSQTRLSILQARADIAL